MSVKRYLQSHKYELLLIALIQHLFIGIFIADLDFYTKIVWPLNMLILGVASIGVFVEKDRWKNHTLYLLFLIVFGLPICLPFFGTLLHFMQLLSWIYMVFFAFIFWEVIRFLVKPSYINIDIISASACGYFLLIEISTFLMQALFYDHPDSFKGIDQSNSAATYVDLVYFSAVTITSIGFGDITPNAHHTKLLTAFWGIAGQFYSVILVGILISKFSSKADDAE